MYGTYNISNCPITGLQRRTSITEFHAVSDKMVLNCFTERLLDGEPVQSQGISPFNVQLVAVDEVEINEQGNDIGLKEFTDFKNMLLSGNSNLPQALQSVVYNADTNGRFN